MKNLIFLELIFILFQSIHSYEHVNKCLNDMNLNKETNTNSKKETISENNLLKIKCESKNKITRIIKAYYGYSWSGDCHYIDKDCIVDVPTEDLNCLGSDGCTIKVIESPIILQDCYSLIATYIQIDYECISIDKLQNMCSIQESEYSSGYIVTPEYPLQLRNDLSCPCTLQAPLGYKIQLEILDFRLNNCIQTGLTVWSDNNLNALTHCLSLQSNTLLTGSNAQNISMRLHTQTQITYNSGFLLKYYSVPSNDNQNNDNNNNENIKIKFVCYGSTQLWKMTNNNDYYYSTLTSNKTTTITTAQTSTTTTTPLTTTSSTSSTTTITTSSISSISSNTFDNSLNKTDNSEATKAFNNLNTNNANNINRQNETITKSFKIIKEDGLNNNDNKNKTDWTIIIISIVASVIFLLVMINALIWFIFSIKSNSNDFDKNLNYLLYTNTIKNNSSNNINQHLNAHSGISLWRSCESLNAFNNNNNQNTKSMDLLLNKDNILFPKAISSSNQIKQQQQQQQQHQRHNQKQKLTKEDKKRLKEFEYLNELRLKKLKKDKIKINEECEDDLNVIKRKPIDKDGNNNNNNPAFIVNDDDYNDDQRQQQQQQLNNQTYLYEEQEGSIDLKSEYSFYNHHHNHQLNNKQHQLLLKQNHLNNNNNNISTVNGISVINTWNDVY